MSDSPQTISQTTDLETVTAPAPRDGRVRTSIKMPIKMPIIASIWAIGVGMLVLLGWILDNDTLKRVVPGLVAMNPVTALSFIACGASLGLLAHPHLSRRGRGVANALAASVALVGLLKLAEVILGLEIGIDRLLFSARLGATQAGQLPNRMAPNTALNFLLLGAALCCIDAPLRLRWRTPIIEWWPFQWLTIAAVCASLLAILGYAYGARYLYGVGSFIPMALHTALSFAALLLGVLYARPARGFMEIVTSYSAGGAMARRLLPAAILLPAALGWLRLTGERMGFYNGEVGVALFVVSVMLVFSILIWWNARALFRTDIERRLAVQGMHDASTALADANAQLLQRNDLMEADLTLAGEIQKAFLPQQHLNFPRTAPAPDSALRFHHRYLPASTLGGDFADILLLSETQAAVFICDVMGHGVRSALVTAVVRGLVEELLPHSGDPGLFLTNLNRSLMTVLSRTKTPMFASAFFLVADIETGSLRYANAGHPSPLLLHRPPGTNGDAASGSVAGGSVEALFEIPSTPSAPDADADNGPALGVFEDFVYGTRSCTLSQGDLLMLFTDGLVEVENDGVEFDECQLQEIVRRHLSLPIPALCDAMLEDVRHFAGEAEFEDDICLVVMEVARVGGGTPHRETAPDGRVEHSRSVSEI